MKHKDAVEKKRLDEVMLKVGDAEKSVDSLRRDNDCLRNLVNKNKEEMEVMVEKVAGLENLLKEEKRKNEEATLMKMELESRLRGINEERKFEAELVETKMRESRVSTCREDLSKELLNTYKESLEASLDELRDDYEKQIEGIKMSFTNPK